MKLSGGQMAAAEPKRSAGSCFDIHFFEGKSSCFHTSDISCHWTTHVSLPIARSSPAYQLCILEENWSKLACMLLSHSLDLRIHVTYRCWFVENLISICSFFLIALAQCFLSAFSALAYLLQRCSALFQDFLRTCLAFSWCLLITDECLLSIFSALAQCLPQHLPQSLLIACLAFIQYCSIELWYQKIPICKHHDKISFSSQKFLALFCKNFAINS